MPGGSIKGDAAVVPIDKADCRIPFDLPEVRISKGETSTSVSAARVIKVEWNRNSQFSKAVLRWDVGRFGSSVHAEEDDEVVITVGGAEKKFTIFRGVIKSISHRMSQPSTEFVEAIAVDLKYHLFKEVIFGQIGTGVTATGKDSEVEDFFTGLPTHFNPRDGQKGKTNKDTGNQKGKGSLLFGGNTKDPWTAKDGVSYIKKFVSKHPMGIASAIAGKDIDFGDLTDLADIRMGDMNVNGNNCLAALTTITRKAGVSYWYNPETKLLEFWRNRKGRKLKKLVFASVPDGLSPGVAVTLKSILIDPWNITAADVNFDFLNTYKSFVGATERCIIQSFFPLRKGWADAFQKEILDLAGKFPSLRRADGTTKLFPKVDKKFLKFFNAEGKILSMLVPDDQHDEFARTFGRLWVTDEAGKLKDLSGNPRGPYPYALLGLSKIDGRSYMIKERPFMARLLDLDASGEPLKPMPGFAKFAPGVRGRDAADQIAKKNVPLQQRSGIFVGLSETGKFPFSVKGGKVRILKKIGGLSIDGGQLHWRVFSFTPGDSKGKPPTMTAFPPVIIAAIQHDQAKLVKLPGAALPFPRRFFDGNRFKFRKKLVSGKVPGGKKALDARETAYSKTVHPPGKGEGTAKAFSIDDVIEEPVDESPAMAEKMTALLADNAKPAVRGSFTIPVITTVYQPGDRITGVEGRLPNALLGFRGTVVSVTFDFVAMTTQFSVESESFKSGGV